MTKVIFYICIIPYEIPSMDIIYETIRITIDAIFHFILVFPDICS